jgi:hypothetical protein
MLNEKLFQDVSARFSELIANSPARRLIQREVLNRAILGTLIQHATQAPVAAAGSPATELQAERAALPRAN